MTVLQPVVESVSASSTRFTRTLGLLAILLGLMVPELQAQPVRVMGAVRDRGSEEAISRAVVHIVETDAEVESAANGFFSFDAPSGEVTLSVSALGYRDTTIVRTVSRGAVVLVLLSPEPLEIEGISAEAVRRGLNQRALALSTPLRSWDEERLEPLQVPSLSNFITERSTMRLEVRGTQLCYLAPASLFLVIRLPIFLDEVFISHQMAKDLRPADLGRVEIFSRVPMIRAYTKRFMADLEAGKVSLMPLEQQNIRIPC